MCTHCNYHCLLAYCCFMICLYVHTKCASTITLLLELIYNFLAVGSPLVVGCLFFSKEHSFSVSCEQEL